MNRTAGDTLSEQGVPALPPIECDLPPAEALASLARAGRRGRLPGYRAVADRSFAVDAAGTPFEYELIGEVDAAESGSVVRFRLERRALMPWIFAVVLAVTIWPGVWLTDSLMATYWQTYGAWTASMPWLTYAWYLPITVLPLPWAWLKCTRTSREQAGLEARKLLIKVRQILAG